jgi:hypothetical protein
LAFAVALVLTAADPAAGPPRALAASGCAAAASPIVCENTLPGTARDRWDLPAAGGSPSIQGFTTSVGVQRGETVVFKINTIARNYRLEIYRMGWYAGNGARFVATVRPSVALPQVQPACRQVAATGLVDCGNWADSARWTVPDDAVSGVFAARLVREDGVFGVNQIVFVVRDDARTSDMLFQTSDATWQAYNIYGGSSLYKGTTRAPAGRAYKVSYNRPLMARNAGVPDRHNSFFTAEYPMLRWLERNGYDVTYTTGADVARLPRTVVQHDAFLSVGHDEYTSAEQRRAMTQARDAGVHLGFFSGNEVYWKTRWEPSIDGRATPFRTLVCYKESNPGRKIDPSPQWTGLWRDMRFSPPSDAGPPENELTGTIFGSAQGGKLAVSVPASYGTLRFWRNTGIALLPPGGVRTFPPGTMGWEFDTDQDNGWRPPGLVHLSETTVFIHHRVGLDWVDSLATHHLTMYRASSGALVFGAGTIEWTWGLDSVHDYALPGPGSAVRDIQQSTVNLFADMRVQPLTLQTDLVPAAPSNDTQAPLLSFDEPPEAAVGVPVTITGTATDAGGVVAAVEVSTDGGATWHPAAGAVAWRYGWTPSASGTTTVMARAADDSGNLQSRPAAVVVSVS